MSSVQIGICGAGSFGCTRANAFASIGGVSVPLGWSRTEATRDAFAKSTGAGTVDTWQELCTDPRIDAVIVCTPHSEHHVQALAALKAGKHVLVETPLALSYPHARELAAAADASGVVLHHGAKWRYHPDYAEHVADLRQVGDLLFATQHAGFDFGVERNWYTKSDLTGGARSFLPYFMLKWLDAFGDTTAAVGAETTVGTWQAAAITLTFAGGGYATINYAIGLGIPELAPALVVGSEGSILTSVEGRAVLRRGGEERPLQPRDVDIVGCECEAFVREIRGERDHRSDLALDLRTHQLLDEAFPTT
jgi:predicted dehydrogenase